MRVAAFDINISDVPAAALTLMNGIYITNNYRPDLDVLAAHEYFHAVQWTYQRACPQVRTRDQGRTIPITDRWLYHDETLRWWMEATAEWAQHEAFSGANGTQEDRSYIGPIDAYLTKPWQHMDYRPVEGGTEFPYSVLFPTYLVEHLPAGRNTIRMTWEAYRDTGGGCGEMLTALQSALGAQNTSMEQLFPEYAEANYSLAYQEEGDFRTTPGYGVGEDFRPRAQPLTLNDQQPRSIVAMAVINPQTRGDKVRFIAHADIVPPAVIFAGGRADANPSDGIGWISRDDGATWISHTFTNAGLVQAVAAVPDTQGTTGYMATADLKLWKTTDAGVNFAQAHDFAPKVWGVIENAHFSVLKIDPTAPNTIYVGLRGKTDPFWGPDRGALFKSTDGGATFSTDLLADCHQQHNPDDWQDCAITSLAIDPHNPNILWIGQNGWNAADQTIMRSNDGGQTWQSRLNGQIDTFTGLALSKANSNVVWAILQQQLSGQYVFHTANGSASWDAVKLDNTLNPAGKTILADPLNISRAWASGGGDGLSKVWMGT